MLKSLYPSTNRGLATSGGPMYRLISHKSNALALKRVAVRPTAFSAPSAFQALQPVMPSLLGGLALGVLATSKLVVSGRVLGISGTVKGLIWGDQSPWRWLFLSGLLAGGFTLSAITPAAFEAFPAIMEPSRILGAGLMVGAGTALGNGCTSGHGICGNARMSPRSFVSTLTFMATGAAAAAALHTAQLFGVPAGFVALGQPAPELLLLSQTVLAASLAHLVSVGLAAKALVRRESPEDGECSIAEQPAAVWLERYSNLATGFLFALGLGASGMLKPSKVSGFLSVLAGTFDPSLIFVMGGALAVALPGYQLVTRMNLLRKPLCCDAFNLPSTQSIDAKLVAGAALFGAGWGTLGICPGPGIVSLATTQGAVIQFVLAMMVGMGLVRQWENLSQMLQPRVKTM